MSCDGAAADKVVIDGLYSGSDDKSAGMLIRSGSAAPFYSASKGRSYSVKLAL